MFKLTVYSKSTLTVLFLIYVTCSKPFMAHFCVVKKADFSTNRKSVLSKGNSAQTHTYT